MALAFLEQTHIEFKGKVVDLVMLIVGTLTMVLMWGFAKGLEKL